MKNLGNMRDKDDNKFIIFLKELPELLKCYNKTEISNTWPAWIKGCSER